VKSDFCSLVWCDNKTPEATFHLGILAHRISPLLLLLLLQTALGKEKMIEHAGESSMTAFVKIGPHLRYNACKVFRYDEYTCTAATATVVFLYY